MAKNTKPEMSKNTENGEKNHENGYAENHENRNAENKPRVAIFAAVYNQKISEAQISEKWQKLAKSRPKEAIPAHQPISELTVWEL